MWSASTTTCRSPTGATAPMAPDADDWGGPYDPDYLRANIAGGEGFDWYYASDADRRAGSAHADHRSGLWRAVGLAGQGSGRRGGASAHHDRPGGVRSGSATAWVPKSKPIWFTELGCGAVDKGANQPNVFGDPKSSEDARPYFSNGTPDPLAQRQALRAHLDHWADDANNPASDIYDGRMLERIAIWTWDARPYPAFPAETGVWSDGPNHATGHWLTGRARRHGERRAGPRRRRRFRRDARSGRGCAALCPRLCRRRADHGAGRVAAAARGLGAWHSRYARGAGAAPGECASRGNDRRGRGDRCAADGAAAARSGRSHRAGGAGLPRSRSRLSERAPRRRCCRPAARSTARPRLWCSMLAAPGRRPNGCCSTAPPSATRWSSPPRHRWRDLRSATRSRWPGRGTGRSRSSNCATGWRGRSPPVPCRRCWRSPASAPARHRSANAPPPKSRPGARRGASAAGAGGCRSHTAGAGQLCAALAGQHQRHRRIERRDAGAAQHRRDARRTARPAAAGGDVHLGRRQCGDGAALRRAPVVARRRRSAGRGQPHRGGNRFRPLGGDRLCRSPN